MTPTHAGKNERAILLYITCRDRAEARSIAASLLEERLIACANILDGVNSLYRWQGEIQDDTEALLLAKSIQPLWPGIEKRVKELHSYDTPCIVAWPLELGSREYLAWVAESCLKSGTT